jgi:hypothetical protein
MAKSNVLEKLHGCHDKDLDSGVRKERESRSIICLCADPVADSVAC